MYRIILLDIQLQIELVFKQFAMISGPLIKLLKGNGYCIRLKIVPMFILWKSFIKVHIPVIMHLHSPFHMTYPWKLIMLVHMKVKMSWIGGTSVVEFKGGKATYYRKVASSNTSRLGAHEGFFDCLWRGFLILCTVTFWQKVNFLNMYKGVINGKAGKHLPHPNFETTVIF